MPRRLTHRQKRQQAKRGRSQPRANRVLFTPFEASEFRKNLAAGANIIEGSKELERRRIAAAAAASRAA